MNNIINNAVKLTNEANQASVEREAQRLIGLILGERASIKQFEGRIGESQKQLKAIADNAVTVGSIMGDVRLPDDANPNVQTILAAIAKVNKSNQDAVAIQSTNLIGDITREQNNIEAASKRIAEHQEKLVKLSAEAVTVGQVVGK